MTSTNTKLNFAVKTKNNHTYNIKLEDDIWYIFFNNAWKYIVCVLDLDVFENNLLSTREGINFAVNKDKVILAYKVSTRPEINGSKDFKNRIIFFSKSPFQFKDGPATIQMLIHHESLGNTSRVDQLIDFE